MKSAEPPVPSSALVSTLRETLLSHERRSSAVRPEVTGYLLEHGLAPLHAGLAAAGEAPDTLCSEVWRLMLASVEARRFGVSSDAWRRNEDYPDRYFPLLWLGLVPVVVPAMPAAERLPFVTALFNLGEQLAGPLRATANRVMDVVGARPETLAGDWRAVLERAMVDAGLLAVETIPPARWQRVEAIGHFDFAAVDPGFLPDGVESTEARAFRIGGVCAPGAEGHTAVGLLLADTAGLRLLSLGAGAGAPPAPSSTSAVSGGELRLVGRQLIWKPAGAAAPRCLMERVPLLVPGAVAANEAGDLVLLDAASARVFLGRLCA